MVDNVSGKWKFGPLRLGASNVLQEILTYKSDDVNGRLKAYEAITKGKPIPKPGVPESFRVLVKELQSLGLDMRVLDEDDQEVELRDLDEGEDDDVIHVDDLEKAREKAAKEAKAAFEKAQQNQKTILTVTKKKVSVKAGRKVKIKASASTADKITFKSMNKKIATVSKKGVVKKKGKTSIRVTCNGVTKKVKVTVK